MARRRSSRRRSDSDYRARGKSYREARIELMTWAGLVMIFAVGALGRENNINMPNWFVPFAGAVVLLGSGFYQYSSRYRVSPITWLGGLVLVLFVLYSWYVDTNQPFVGASLIVFFLVILFGVVTGDT
ncbi:MAG: hypothetical protein KJ065_18880 [Anaerolineae bacterium]|nr:hypothetical protein [Anaerolineae bacterium]